MADADATGHAPDGQVHDRSDEDDNSNVSDSDAPHDYDSDAPPPLGDTDHGRDTLLIVDGAPVAGEFVALAAPNAPDVPLAAARVAPPRAGELRLHHLTARYGLAVDILALAQTQRVIFERRIRDLELDTRPGPHHRPGTPLHGKRGSSLATTSASGRYPTEGGNHGSAQPQTRVHVGYATTTGSTGNHDIPPS